MRQHQHTSPPLYDTGDANDAVVQVFLDDMANFAEMNAEYEKWFTHKPARTCVAVKTLPKGVPVRLPAPHFIIPLFGFAWVLEFNYALGLWSVALKEGGVTRIVLLVGV